jgi:hypothetical protein
MLERLMVPPDLGSKVTYMGENFSWVNANFETFAPPGRQFSKGAWHFRRVKA